MTFEEQKRKCPNPNGRPAGPWHIFNTSSDGIVNIIIGVKTVICDINDLKTVQICRWKITPQGYVANTKYGLMHHLIMGKPIKPLVIDHINGDKRDNRRSNLRVLKRTLNALNRHKHISNTKLTGIHKMKSTGHFQVSIMINGKSFYLGYYRTLEEAIEIRKRVEVLIWNFQNHSQN